jgi:integrase
MRGRTDARQARQDQDAVSVHPITRQDGSRAHKVRWRERGRNRARTFSLKRDADAFDREVERRRQLGPLAVQQLTNRGPTLGEWIAERWAPEHAATLEQSTRERYANAYAVHIAPWLDDVPLQEITVARLRGWQVERVKAGTKAGTIHKCRTLLSSVLRHAAESEAIPANPLSVVRAPKNPQRDAVRPLAPALVEKIRAVMLDPPAREVVAISRHAGDLRHRRYELPAPGTPQTRHRDALIVSLLAYTGIRPGELRALRWSDIGENTITIQRGANPDGSIKSTKTETRRTIRLLAAPTQDLREHRLAVGRPAERSLIISTDSGKAWSKTDWQMWRVDRWAPACRDAGLEDAPRPYDLRHSFASLLLAEGRQPLYVARQLGHSLAVLLGTYAHLIDEYDDAQDIDANVEIAKARRTQPRTRTLHDAG